MKASSVLLTLTALLILGLPAQAQTDTAHHRAVYSQINAQLASFQKVTATHKDEPTEFALTGWLDGGKVRKIVAKNGDDGEGVEEYYLENEKPLFVFSTYYQNAEDGKRGAKVEERLYFKEGSIFKWLPGHHRASRHEHRRLRRRAEEGEPGHAKDPGGRGHLRPHRGRRLLPLEHDLEVRRCPFLLHPQR
jgi:hypothetical protein